MRTVAVLKNIVLRTSIQIHVVDDFLTIVAQQFLLLPYRCYGLSIAFTQKFPTVLGCGTAALPAKPPTWKCTDKMFPFATTRPIW